MVRRLTVNQEMRRFDSCPRSQFWPRIVQRQDGVLIKLSRLFDSTYADVPGFSSGDGASPTKKISRVRSSTPVPNNCAPVPEGIQPSLF